MKSKEKMRRALSQPLLWIRSPSTSRDRSDTEMPMVRAASGACATSTGATPAFASRNGSNRKPGCVQWEESCSEEDSPKLDRSKSIAKARKSSMSPATPMPHGAVADAVDIGSYATSASSCLAISSSSSSSSVLPFEKRGLKMAAIFAGRGGATCSRYLAEHLESCIGDAFDSLEVDSVHDDRLPLVFTQGFHDCDSMYNVRHAHDGSGSCALVALVQGRSVHVAWTGECRAVLCCGQDVKPITWDHHPTDQNERKRVLDNGGLIAGGLVMGILPTSRGFGENDLKTSFSKGVFTSDPSVAAFTIDDPTASTKTCFMIMASQSVFAVMSNDAACKIVSKALARHENNVTIAARKLAKAAEKKSPTAGVGECAVTVLLWSDTTQRSRSSSATSWRSMRSFSAQDLLEEHR